jgi:hypothetical protein
MIDLLRLQVIIIVAMFWIGATIWVFPGHPISGLLAAVWSVPLVGVVAYSIYFYCRKWRRPSPRQLLDSGWCPFCESPRTGLTSADPCTLCGRRSIWLAAMIARDHQGDSQSHAVASYQPRTADAHAELPKPRAKRHALASYSLDWPAERASLSCLFNCINAGGRTRS